MKAVPLLASGEMVYIGSTLEVKLERIARRSGADIVDRERSRERERERGPMDHQFI